MLATHLHSSVDHSSVDLGKAARNTAILAALVDAGRSLGAAGLRSLPLKGAALLAAGVVKPWERHLDDLDLWVPRDRARQAFDVLVDAGFRPLSGPTSATHAGADSLEAPSHQLPVLRSPHGALVEIHLESHARGDAGEFDACYAAGRDVDVFGAAVRVPCAPHVLEHLCAHVVLHHFGDLRFWPRHVNDVQRLVEHAPPLAALDDRPDEVGLSLRVAHGAVDPRSADAWLTRLFLDPSSSTRAAWRVASVAARAARFARDDPGGFGRVLVPSSKHLAFTGDLVDGRSLPGAHLRRWRRIAGRALGT
ncbi:MAG: nucleotidyltransferase family protein [Deltaproteobacteria bacterium]|nr:nucleotidyltransferase family protein [Deltaproteobacteria bacterium]